MNFKMGNGHKSDIVGLQLLMGCKSNTCLINLVIRKKERRRKKKEKKRKKEKEFRAPYTSSLSRSTFLCSPSSYSRIFSRANNYCERPFIKASPDLRILRENFRCFNHALQPHRHFSPSSIRFFIYFRREIDASNHI